MASNSHRLTLTLALAAAAAAANLVHLLIEPPIARHCVGFSWFVIAMGDRQISAASSQQTYPHGAAGAWPSLLNGKRVSSKQGSLPQWNGGRATSSRNN
ncbi:hypothetical protein V8C26DRAFT_409483 [Trichoderma gracile]